MPIQDFFLFPFIKKRILYGQTAYKKRVSGELLRQAQDTLLVYSYSGNRQELCRYLVGTCSCLCHGYCANQFSCSYITKNSTLRSRCQVYDKTRRTQDSKRPPTMEVTSTFERFARLSFTCSPFCTVLALGTHCHP